MIRRIIAACLVVFGFGCAGADAPKSPLRCDRFYAVSFAFNADQKHDIEEANESWNRIAVQRFCLAPGDNSEHGVVLLGQATKEWQDLSDEAHGLNVRGAYTSSTDEITLVDGTLGPLFKATALHELGHARGLHHVQGPAIMKAELGSAFAFTDNDLTECRRVGACMEPTIMPAKPDADECMFCKSSE